MENVKKTQRYQASNNQSKKELFNIRAKLVSKLCNKMFLGKFISNKNEKDTDSHEETCLINPINTKNQ